MVTTVVPSLPIRSEGTVVATPGAILEKPSLGEREKDLVDDLKDVVFSDIDPGVFNEELIKLRIYAQPNPDNLAKQPKLGGGNIEQGTYAGTQAALTHAYSRIERSFESYFDVLQVEPTLPRFTALAPKQDIYQYSAYPIDEDGKPSQYPPHLQTIPKKDQVSQLEIFNALGLAETSQLIKQVVPDTFLGKTAQWLFHLKNGNIEAAADQGMKIQDFVDYNQKHRKSGTDIQQGQNIGLLKDWFSDRRFAEQTLTGTNPTTIYKIPTDLLQEFIATAKRTKQDYWAKKIPEIDPASLFVQDHRYYRKAFKLKPDQEMAHKEPSSDKNWLCAAVTLFQLHPDGKIHPIAIVCDYKVSMDKSVTIFNKRRLPTDPSDGEINDWPWRYAKTCAQVADWVRHEIGVHLTKAHFIEEALIVGTHRAIPMDHIVFKILHPHWYKTLSLNAAARETLVPQIIKDLVGVSPDSLFAYVRYEFENFDYVKGYIPNDLATRGFPNTAKGLEDQKFKNYAYAKNMLAMWTTIRAYVRGMLLTEFDEKTADKQVQADGYIKNWCTEVQTGGWIKTFPSIQTFDQLCDAVTMCIHIASPFHTAVNYLQSFYQSFVFAKPAALCQPLPVSLDDLNTYTERSLLVALPAGRQREWLLSVQIPWLLSFKVASDRSLLMFAHSQWQAHRVSSKPKAGDKEAEKREAIGNISEAFFKNLQECAKQFLKNSNAMDKDSIPYMVLDPGTTAVSILI